MIMDLEKKIAELKSTLKIAEKENRVREIETEMQSEGFWNNQEMANERTKELKNLKNEIKKVTDLEELVEIAGDDEQEIIESEIKKLEILTYFSGKYDDHSAIINFYSGAGGDDAQDWTEMLLKMYLRFAENNDFEAKILNQTPGQIAGVKSATLEIDGNYAYGRMKRETGVHRLVRQSPFNAKDLRQTSFSLVEVMPKISPLDKLEIPASEIKIDTFRAGGHGGQSVNTTDSAVRITHIPTGIVAICQNERSQLQNKAAAMSVLSARLAKMLEDQHKEKISELRGESAEPEWGSQIRSYILHPYKLVKDHRTNFESSNPEAVLAGGIEGLLEAEVKN
ncbi:MAG: peptide chain release factor 2 [Candidatus Berkelbacteria bacterium]|nr:peptide chain release factor 2 [Candidatus Berkelbacteria bacterium]